MGCDFLIVSRDEDSEPDLGRLLRALEPGSTVLRGSLCRDRIPQLELRGSAAIEVDAWAGLSGPFFEDSDLDGFVERRGMLVAVGYSDGASLVAALTVCARLAIGGAILVRPTATFDRVPPPLTCRFPVLVLSGLRDPVVSPSDSALLGVQLSMAGIDVTHRQLANGHGISRHDHDACKDWLAELRSRRTSSGSRE